jgi:asparagine synthase (glutamine-hydrolysing)
MWIDDGRFAIVYNGEVYNYRELRVALEAEGEVFGTTGDTEVLLRGLVLHGPAYLERLNGIFALALWDRLEGRLLLARDHLGIKPLYWANTSRHLVFASEPKAIFASGLVGKALNREALYEYFCRQAPPYPGTLYKGVQELEAGRWMEVDVDGSVTFGTHYELENAWQSTDPALLPDAEAAMVDMTEQMLTVSVARQLVSDVPVGILLSQGIDSGLLCHYMNNSYVAGELHAFTYSNQKGQDEAGGARQMVERMGERLHHHVLPVTLSGHLGAFGEATRLFDAPVIYPSSLPILDIAKMVGGMGTKVLMSGQGADELFMGYPRYARWVRELGGVTDPRRWEEHFYYGGGIGNVALVEALTGTGRAAVEASPAWTWVARHWDLPELKRMALYDQRFRLLYLLKREDRMGMGGSVENRVPFLDKEFVTWANAVPDRWKIREGRQKYILGRTAERVLPKNIALGRKIGSPTVFEQWLASPAFIRTLRELVRAEGSLVRTCLAPEVAETIIDRHEDKGCYGFLTWCLFTLECWYCAEFGATASNTEI